MSATAPAPARWQTAVVEEIRVHGPRARSLFLRGALPPHLAGQHLDLRLVAEDGYEARRSYSIASAPGEPLLELMVERLAEGEVSPYLHDELRVGDTLEIRGPIGGHFVWRPTQPGPLLLLAGGSGIAPLMAMLRQRATLARAAPPTLLLYSGRRWEELVYHDELATLAAQDPTLRFTAITTRAAPTRPGDLGQRLDAAHLQAQLQAWAQPPREVYACGATGFVESLSSALVAQGVPASAIRAERYGGAG